MTVNDLFVESPEEKVTDCYPPVPNHINPSAGWAGGDGTDQLFETSGHGFESVRRQCTKESKIEVVDRAVRRGRPTDAGALCEVRKQAALRGAVSNEGFEMHTTIPRADAHGERPGTESPRVLVVDDDDTLRMVLTRELRKRGFDVYSTDSGAEAVELYCRSSRRIDLVLMDVNMPGMNGVETLDALRVADPCVRCCFMTADLRASTQETLLARGALAVFDKPFASLSDLCESLRGHASPPADGSAITTEEACR